MNLAKTLLVVGCLLLSSITQAADGKPSEDSVRRLMEVTEARKLVDQMYQQFDNHLASAMKQSLQGREIPAETQAFMQKTREKLVRIFQEEASWEKLEPIYLKIYADHFTQEEVDGMLAFYKTPTGQAMIKKMPAVTHSSMREVQVRMQPIMAKMSALLQEETAAFSKEEQKKKETQGKK